MASTTHASGTKQASARHGEPHVRARSRVTYVDTAIARIEEDLHSGKYPPGSFMGTQRDLALAYDLKASVLLQAIRVLIHRGDVELRQGNGGGIFASNNSVAFVGKRMATYLECIGIDFADAVRVSELLQEMCARKGTGMLSLEQAAKLSGTMNRLQASDPFDRRNLLGQMFQQFAEGSGDVVLSLLFRVITDVMLDVTVPHPSLHSDTLLADYPPLRLGAAVIAGDHNQSALVFQEWREILRHWNDTILSDSRPKSRPSEFADRTASSGNLAERLAAHMLGELRMAGWPAGQHLGSEPELLARYNVSRATFRQALRLLEDYSAVETRRGPGGGVFVGMPSAAVIHGTALSLLVSNGATISMSREMLAQLMAEALDMALEHGASSAIQAASQPTDLSLRDHIAHIASVILHHADNKVVGIFVRLLVELEARLHRNDKTPLPEGPAAIIALLALSCPNDRVAARCAIINLIRENGIAAF